MADPTPKITGSRIPQARQASRWQEFSLTHYGDNSFNLVFLAWTCHLRPPWNEFNGRPFEFVKKCKDFDYCSLRVRGKKGLLGTQKFSLDLNEAWFNLDAKFDNSQLLECVQNSKVIIIFVNRYRPFHIHCIGWFCWFCRCISSPAVTLADTRLLALFNFGFIIIRELSTFCTLRSLKVIITIVKALTPFNYHFLQGVKLIRNLLFWILLFEWNIIKAYSPDTWTVIPVTWPQYLPNTRFISLLICR